MASFEIETLVAVFMFVLIVVGVLFYVSSCQIRLVWGCGTRWSNNVEWAGRQ